MKILLATLLLLVLPTHAQSDPPLDRVKLPPGFEITLFAAGVDNAHSMALGDMGTLFVGTRSAGKVHAIRHDGRKATEDADSAWGRPVDVLVMPDGALLVSDDRANAIYRIAHKRPG